MIRGSISPTESPPPAAATKKKPQVKRMSSAGLMADSVLNRKTQKLKDVYTLGRKLGTASSGLPTSASRSFVDQSKDSKLKTSILGSPSSSSQAGSNLVVCSALCTASIQGFLLFRSMLKDPSGCSLLLGALCAAASPMRSATSTPSPAELPNNHSPSIPSTSMMSTGLRRSTRVSAAIATPALFSTPNSPILMPPSPPPPPIETSPGESEHIGILIKLRPPNRHLL